MMHSEPYSRTVKIPIKIVNGYPCLFPEGRFPELKEGTIGDLVVPAEAFADQKLVAELTRESKTLFLPKETRLVAMINPEKVPAHLRDHLTNRIPGHMGSGVEFHLQEAQYALLRGTKNTTLEPCPCIIPCLDKEAKSINHAYSLISEVFEPHRISHTGNVFTKVYYHDGTIWRSLKAKRGH